MSSIEFFVQCGTRGLIRSKKDIKKKKKKIKKKKILRNAQSISELCCTSFPSKTRSGKDFIRPKVAEQRGFAYSRIQALALPEPDFPFN